MQIFHVSIEKQSAVKPRDEIGKKEEPALIVLSWSNTQSSLFLPYRLSLNMIYLLKFRGDTSLFFFSFIFKI